MCTARSVTFSLSDTRVQSRTVSIHLIISKDNILISTSESTLEPISIIIRRHRHRLDRAACPLTTESLPFVQSPYMIVQVIADYVYDYKIGSDLARETAVPVRPCLIDTVGCDLEGMRFPKCLSVSELTWPRRQGPRCSQRRAISTPPERADTHRTPRGVVSSRGAP